MRLGFYLHLKNPTFGHTRAIDTRDAHMERTMSATFVLCSATHMLVYINSQCEQAHQFGVDYSKQF